ncbi:MAG TPA: ParA family protein [Thioploca sp.]|nr:ParA family protein [Thioploca sp.]
MMIPIIAGFNVKGGSSKSFLVYHLAWMYQTLGLNVVVADLDPQATVTAAFFDEFRLEERRLAETEPNTVFRCVQPLVAGSGDITKPQLEEIDEQLALLGGDLSLFALEEAFSKAWYSTPNEDSIQILSAFWRVLQQAATIQNADIVLVDVGSNLGAINRAALIAADYVIVPVAPELLSVQGMEQSGITLQRWREDWQRRLKHYSNDSIKLPQGNMQPVGYVIFQEPIRLYLGTNMYAKWAMQIPKVYRRAMLNEPAENTLSIADDPHFLAIFKGFFSVITMAQEARKPVFHLKPADGAMGAYLTVVQSAFVEFQRLAREIAKRVGIVLPDLTRP